MKLSELSLRYNEMESKIDDSTTQTVETEYSFFAKVNPAELVKQFKEDVSITSQIFIEGIVAFDPAFGKLRMRHYPNSKKPSVTILEHKTKIDKHQSIETSTEVPESFLKPLISKCESVTSRIRYFIPAKTPAGNVIKYSDGKILVWEVDLYMNSLDPNDLMDTSRLSEWAKIELEVREAVLDSKDVKSRIPFECEQVVESDTKDESERLLIDALFTKVYNLAGKPTAQPQRPPVDTGADNNDTTDKPATTATSDTSDGDFKFEGGEGKVEDTPPAKPEDNSDDDGEFNFNGGDDNAAEKPKTEETKSDDEGEFKFSEGNDNKTDVTPPATDDSEGDFNFNG